MVNDIVFIVRIEEKRTVYSVSEVLVKAETREEAKKKILEDSNDVEVLNSWDNESEDYEYINKDNWEYRKGKKQIYGGWNK